MSLKREVIQSFRQRFGGPPAWVVRAPGRVNLMGDHTDYNDGFVLPLAIEQSVWIALRPRKDDHVIVSSRDFNEEFELDLKNFQKENIGWKEYVKGVAWSMGEAGVKGPGWEGVVVGDVPVGSGLSSSAAFGLALARSFATVAEVPWDPIGMAHLVQKAENGWVGVASGIMDPLISAVATADKAALIDCRSLEVKHVSLPSQIGVLIMDTRRPRSLAGSAYNERRRQCEQAAQFFGLSSLRDLNWDQLMAKQTELDPILFNRARHVLTENQRVLDAVVAFEANDLVTLGGLLKASHASLRDDYEVSCKELDVIVEAANKQPGCIGARMTGAGFGGCAVALVERQYLDEVSKNVATEYKIKTGTVPQMLVSSAAKGADLETF